MSGQRWRKVIGSMSLVCALVVGLVMPAQAQPVPAVTDYYHVDALGSLRNVTNDQGVVITRYDYAPFGDLNSPCTTSPDGRLFTGHERDRETCLDYMGARYYRSTDGRFLTLDPALDASAALIDPQRWNRYAYANNNPTRYVDPDGREIAIMHAGRLINVGFDTTPVGDPNAKALLVIAAAGTLGSLGPVAAPLARGFYQVLFGCAVSASCTDRTLGVLEGIAGGAPTTASRGFVSQAKLDSHFAAHASEWAPMAISKSQYLERAQSLLRSPVGGDIMGHIRANGDILRYNRLTNEFVASQADGTIRTFFRPTAGLEYWMRQQQP